MLLAGALGDVRDFLPFSDAKKGPLSDLTASGKALTTTFLEGIRKAGGLPVIEALFKTETDQFGTPNVGAPALGGFSLPNIDNLFPVGPVPQAAGTGGAGANGGQNQAGAQAFNITIERIEVNAEGGDAQEIAANIADSLAQQVRSMVEQVDTRVRA